MVIKERKVTSTVTLSTRHLDMIDELIKKRGAFNLSAFIRDKIEEEHSRE